MRLHGWMYNDISIFSKCENVYRKVVTNLAQHGLQRSNKRHTYTALSTSALTDLRYRSNAAHPNKSDISQSYTFPPDAHTPLEIFHYKVITFPSPNAPTILTRPTRTSPTPLILLQHITQPRRMMVSRHSFPPSAEPTSRIISSDRRFL